MTQITGTLVWDTSVAEHHGWLLFSPALLDGAACIPSPDYYGTDADANEELLADLVLSTVRWEGYADADDVCLTRDHDGYTWSAESHADDET